MPTKTIYIKEEHIPLFEMAEKDGSVSGILAGLLEEKYREPGTVDCEMTIVVKYLTSEAWRVQQAKNGKHAPEKITLQVKAPLPEELAPIAKIQETACIIDLQNHNIYYQTSEGYWKQYSDTGRQYPYHVKYVFFDKKPESLHDILEHLKNYRLYMTDEMEAHNDNLEKADDERREQHRQKQEKEYEERKEKQETEVKERQEKEEKLKTWALEHGDELLKSRIAGEFSWHDLAKKAYMEEAIKGAPLTIAEDPDGFSHSQDLKRDKPTLQDLEQLDSLCKFFATKEVSADCQLRYEVYKREGDEYWEAGDPDEELVIKRTEIRVDIHTILGHKTAWFLVSTQEEEGENTEE